MHSTPANQHNIKRLAILRLITLTGLTGALWAINALQLSSKQGLAVWSILAVMVALSAANLYRAKAQNLRSYEIGIYLVLDSLLIAALMYFTGGANNPFITYMLVPIVISAATLSWWVTWSLCMLAMTLYGLLLFVHQPLAALDLKLAEWGLSFHIIGMWFTFILSALLIVYFVVDMAMDLRFQERQVAYLREKTLQNEHLMLLASQAASTAHEIGTPLTTMKMLTHELALDHTLSDDAKEDLALISQQIFLCQSSLKNLGQETQLEQENKMPLGEYLHHVLNQWLLLFPSGQYQWTLPPDDIEHMVQYPKVITQAILNLLNNAAQAGSGPLMLSFTPFPKTWTLEIQDNGPGVSQDFHLPNKQVPSEQGLGIGLLISHSSIQRLGGRVTLNNQNQGCLTTIELPFYVG